MNNTFESIQILSPSDITPFRATFEMPKIFTLIKSTSILISNLFNNAITHATTFRAFLKRHYFGIKRRYLRLLFLLPNFLQANKNCRTCIEWRGENLSCHKGERGYPRKYKRCREYFDYRLIQKANKLLFDVSQTDSKGEVDGT